MVVSGPMEEHHPRADAAAVVTCFAIPGLIAGALSGAVTHGQGAGVWTSAARGAVLGALGAGAVGSTLALALRAGIDSPSTS